MKGCRWKSGSRKTIHARRPRWLWAASRSGWCWWSGTRKRTIPFAEIGHVGIGYLGKALNYVTFYYLLLKLNSGEEYALFAPGRFFPGASDRPVVEGWRQRLETCIDHQGPPL